MEHAAPGGVDRLCPRYQRAIDIIGKRWTGLILRVLLDGPRRFGQIQAAIGGLSERMLSERLKELEACGIVARHVYPTTPVRIEYSLTDKGRDLQEAIAAIQRWAERWAELPTHPCCGTESALPFDEAEPVRTGAGR